MEMTNRAYAKHRGITEGAVRKALSSGRISNTPSGKIDSELADKQWCANTRTSLDDTTASSYKQSRAVREAYNAKMAKLEFEKESGRLIEKDQVRVDMFNAGRVTRDRILAVPDKVIPKLVGKTDIREMKEILKGDLTEALRELARYGKEACDHGKET